MTIDALFSTAARRGVLAFFVMAAAASRASAEPPPWQTERFEYSTAGAQVRDALAELSRQTHVPIVTDPDVAGQFAGRFNLAPQRFLEMLTTGNDLDWYFDGAVLHVSRGAARRTLAIRLDYASPDALLDMLREIRLTDVRYAPQIDEAASVVIVYGPPAYVERVGQAARTLERSARERVRSAVRVVKLDAARAADREEHDGARVIVVPGVASALRERGAAARAKPLEAGIVPVEYETPLPIFEADATNNAVLVRDRPERLDADAAMIEAFDRRPPLVRLVAYVAEIDADALAALPLPWRTSTDAAAPRIAYTDDNGTELVAQLHTFAREGRATIVLARDATTVDGTPVTLDRYEDRLVEAANRDDGTGSGGGLSPLLDVSTGMALDVTPTVEPKSAANPDAVQVALNLRLTTEDAQNGKPGVQGASVVLEARAEVAQSRCLVIASATPPAMPAALGASATARESSAPVEAAKRTRLIMLIPYVSGI